MVSHFRSLSALVARGEDVRKPHYTDRSGAKWAHLNSRQWSRYVLWRDGALTLFCGFHLAETA